MSDQRPGVDIPCFHMRALVATSRALGISISPKDKPLLGSDISVYMRCLTCAPQDPGDWRYFPANMFYPEPQWSGGKENPVKL